MVIAALDGTKEVGNVEIDREPGERYAELALEIVGRIFGEICVGTLVIDIDAQVFRRHGSSLRRRSLTCNLSTVNRRLKRALSKHLPRPLRSAEHRAWYRVTLLFS